MKWILIICPILLLMSFKPELKYTYKTPIQEILAKVETYNRSDLENYVRKVEREKEFRLPAKMLHTLIIMESNYNTRAINPADPKNGNSATSYGLGQVTEATGWGVCGLTREELYDPYKNIRCSAKVIKYQINRSKNNIPYAVASYNAGTPCVCDGMLYKRPMWDYKLKKVVNKACKVADVGAYKQVGKKKIRIYRKKEMMCSVSDIGRFINQGYVDKFNLLWKGN